MFLMSSLLHHCHSLKSLSVRDLAPRTLNYCPRYSQNPFYMMATNSCSANSASTTAGRKPNDGTMMAAVIYKAGGPEAFELEKRQIPKPVSIQ